jgi:hypothetical protein
MAIGTAISVRVNSKRSSFVSSDVPAANPAAKQIAINASIFVAPGQEIGFFFHHDPKD